MHRGRQAASAALRAAALCLAALLWTAPHASAASSLWGDAGPKPHPGKIQATASPAEIQQFLTLLADPKLQEWLKRQGEIAAAAADRESARVSALRYFDTRLTALRAHIKALAATLPDMPRQFQQGESRISAELGAGGRIKTLLIVAAFVAFGFAVEWLFGWATRKIRRNLEARPLDTVNDRLHAIATRFAFAAGSLAAFAVGSIGAFLSLDWPHLLREMIWAYLIAILVIRAARVVGKLLLSPDAERLRVIPMDGGAARFWLRRVCAFVGWFAVGWMFVGLLQSLGYTLEGRRIVAYTLGLGLMAIALEAVWRRPHAAPGGSEPALPAGHRIGRGAHDLVLSVGIALLWGLWVLRVMPGFWLLLVVIVLPLAIAVTSRAVEQLLRPPGAAELDAGPSSVVAVCIKRGMRALLIIGAAAVLAWGWDIDLLKLTGQNTGFARLAHGLLSAVVILLVADLLWHALKTWIDAKLAEPADPGRAHTDEARRRARLRTLLPIFRNVLFVLVIAVAVMMALAEMGVEIGPLIAGAGVVGVAIGLGAQGLVRDVISGMFYLLDDAFRVGEYIQSGNYKGTVEGFSIRSVRLRHQNGPLYTVPFGLLGAVQNQSRDWVIDKMTVGITYDSDVERARKLIKKIGEELAEDPEFAPLILEPLKMQGIDQLGEFAVQLRMKMMTLPGEQFAIRRRAYAMIKKAFEANGIKFAFPTVQVAGDSGAAAAAAAQRTLELMKPAAE